MKKKKKAKAIAAHFSKSHTLIDQLTVTSNLIIQEARTHIDPIDLWSCGDPSQTVEDKTAKDGQSKSHNKKRYYNYSEEVAFELGKSQESPSEEY